MNESELSEYTHHLNKIRAINEGISEQLFGSVIYLLKYSEKHGIKLPRKEELERILFNTKPLLESYNQALDELEQTKKLFKNTTPTENLQGEDQPQNGQNPKRGAVKLVFDMSPVKNRLVDYFRWYFLNKSSVSSLVSNNSLKNSIDIPAPLNLGGGYSLSSFSQSIKSNFAISTNEIGNPLYFIIISSGLFFPLSVEIVIGYFIVTDDFIKQDPKE